MPGTIEHRRWILLVITCVLLAAAALACVFTDPFSEKGELVIDPGVRNTLTLNRYGIVIEGIDRDGITYFCLPSFSKLKTLDQSKSSHVICTPDGKELKTFVPGTVQDILVSSPEGDMAPWKICFLHSEKLYSVFIDLDDSKPEDIEHDLYTGAAIKVISPSGREECLEKNAYIKGRGNATWAEPFYPKKKPYDIKFTEDESMCGMLPGKKWALLADHFEGTGMLNKMVFDTAVKMDMTYVSDSDWADVYMNDRYLGTYTVCSEPQESAKSVIDAGGYLVEKNDVYYDKKPVGFKTANDSFTVKAPDEISSEEVYELETFFGKMDSEIRSSSSCPEELDRDSFSRWFLLEELFFNEDALVSSCYFYLPSGLDRMYAGPPWDFDCVCGEAYGRYLDPEGSILDENDTRDPIEWYGLLDKDREFYDDIVRIYEQYLPVFEELVDNGIDGYYEKISSSLEMDRAVWGCEGYGEGAEYTVPGYYASIRNNYRFTKNFLYKRLKSLSERFGTAEPACSFVPGNGKQHDLIFICPDGSEVRTLVEDGESPIIPEELGDIQDWRYEINGLPMSEFIPVYEDTVFVCDGAENTDE